MKTLRKLGNVAAAAGLSAVVAFSAVPANASVQGRNTLLGAGIGAVAGGLLGRGRIGPVVGGAAAGAAAGALLSPHHKHYAYWYDRHGYRHRAFAYSTGRHRYYRRW